MEPLLVKIFAIALAFSQVATAPDAIKTQFDRTRDQEQVAKLLHAGCTHIRKTFDIEGINLDDLITTALDDSQVSTGENQLLRGINFADLQPAYWQFCSVQKGVVQAVDLGEVIDFYNKAAADLPDHTMLKGLKFAATSVVLDGAGRPFADLFRETKRRTWVPLADIPTAVQSAFIAAEDRRFSQHQGIDERGLMRAFVGNLAQPGRPQGGSTITQQLVKNLLVGDDVSYERKIREMLVAARVERLLSKAEILELYLNSIYMGRGAWGLEAGSRAYFGKPASELTLQEGAFLAALVKGPNYFNPDRHPGRAQERLAYVLDRLREDGLLPIGQPSSGLPVLPLLVDQRPRRNIGFYFSDQVIREAKSVAGIEAGSATTYVLRSTINQQLQRAVEEALQEGLSRYERNAGRAQFTAPEANLAKAVQRAEADKNTADKRPAWQRALITARLPLYDVHWVPAVVIDQPAGSRGGALRVGLRDGRIVPLSLDGTTERKLAPYDVVLVRVEGKKASLRVRPEVQGAAVVLENATGGILAMTGGFSYPVSQLNRVTQAMRQPGSTIKPLSYLAALGRGVQPNTLVMDEPITLPPIGRKRASEEDSWTPNNYDGGSGGVLTLRSALEKSRNLATAHLLVGGIDKKPEDSLNRLCDLALEAQIYRDCVRFYPFVLGAQPVRPIDLATFYAAIATEGTRPTPYVVESIERDGQVIYRHQRTVSTVESVDQAAFYQLKTMLQGVLARGTATAIAALAPYVAGKTGTSDDANDVWFVGFTNDVTVAVWIGYDNAGKRRTLGDGVTGGSVAVPIFEAIIQAAWAGGVPKTVLSPPSAEAKRRLRCTSSGRRGAFSECLRINAKGKVLDTESVLLSGKDVGGRLMNYVRAQASSVHVTKEGEADSSEKLVETQGSAIHTRPEGEADTPEKLADIKAKSPDTEQDRDVRRSRRYARAKTQSDDANQDLKASRSRKDARAKKPDKDREASRPTRYPRASRTSASSWNDPWRSQWTWQGQYGQTSNWGRWR